MSLFVSVLQKIVGSLSSTRSLVLKIGNSHVSHLQATNMMLEALASKAGNRAIAAHDFPMRYPDVDRMLTDDYMLSQATVFNGRMEKLDLSKFVKDHSGYSIFPSLMSKIRANGWQMYLSLQLPEEYPGDFPVNGLWISGK